MKIRPLLHLAASTILMIVSAARAPIGAQGVAGLPIYVTPRLGKGVPTGDTKCLPGVYLSAGVEVSTRRSLFFFWVRGRVWRFRSRGVLRVLFSPPNPRRRPRVATYR